MSRTVAAIMVWTLLGSAAAVSLRSAEGRDILRSSGPPETPPAKVAGKSLSETKAIAARAAANKLKTKLSPQPATKPAPQEMVTNGSLPKTPVAEVNASKAATKRGAPPAVPLKFVTSYMIPANGMACVQGPRQMMRSNLMKLKVSNPKLFAAATEVQPGTCREYGYKVGPIADACLENETKIFLDWSAEHRKQMQVGWDQHDFSNSPSLATLTAGKVQSLLGAGCVAKAEPQPAAVAKARPRRPDAAYVLPASKTFCLEGRYFHILASNEALKNSKPILFKDSEVLRGSCADAGFKVGPVGDPCFPGADIFLDWNGDHRYAMGVAWEFEAWSKKYANVPTMRQLTHGKTESIMGPQCTADPSTRLGEIADEA